MTTPLKRLPWLLGLVLLAASLIGAGQGIQQPTTTPSTAASTKAPPPPAGPTCIGRVDVEPGLLYLGPLQPGEITELRAVEGQKVKKGDVLLTVNDEPFVPKLVQAEIAARIAAAQVEQAQQAIAVLPSLIDGQKAAVKVAEQKWTAAKTRLPRLEKLRALPNPQVTDDELTAVRAEIDALGTAIEAEKAKLAHLELSRPEAKLREAQENLTLAKARIDEAKLRIDRCRLRAPVDCLVLQVLAGVGAQFGPGARTPAVILAPDVKPIVRVEVDQEFANRVSLHQPASIHDDANPSLPPWTGKVVRVSEGFMPKRPTGAEVFSPLGVSDARPLELIVDLDKSDQPLPKIGQRMRVTLGAPAAHRNGSANGTRRD